MSPRFLLRMLVLVVVCLNLMAGLVLAAGTLDRQATIDQINEHMRQGQRSAALPLCRLYVAEYPGDPIMQYNLACLENTAGRTQAAEAAYIKALAAGFMKFDIAAQDSDLQGALHQVVLALNQAAQDRLLALAHELRLALRLGQWSELRELQAHGTAQQSEINNGAQPQLRVKWQDSGLDIELTADQQWATMFTDESTPPWLGGPGFMLSLGMLSGDEISSGNHFLFAFGFQAKAGVGAMFISTQGHWQQVVELTPKIKVNEAGELNLVASIPWQALLPYHPLVDTPLGINATLFRYEDQGRTRASLLATNDTLDPVAPQRRFVPLDFQADSISDELFLGKLSNTISGDQPLVMDLLAISAQAGHGTLSLNFTDQAGRSVLPSGPMQISISLQKGANHISRQADFSSLNTGGYVLQAELLFPSGQRKTWNSAVLQLANNWQEEYEENMSMVGQPEQATTRYLMNSIEKALASHQPRRSPGAIVTTLLDLDRMLGNAADSGTILPAKGNFDFIYPGAQGQNMICRMYLPAGRHIADGVNPVLVLSKGQGMPARLAARIGRNYEFGKQVPTLKTGNDALFPAYLVPELPNINDISASELQAEVDACLRWALTYFETRKVSVVGIDDLGATALQYTNRAPQLFTGVLVFAGSNINPWPGAQPEVLREKLGTAPADLNLTWIDFPAESNLGGQAQEILQALKDLNFRLDDTQTVRGGLALTQVADRLVVWAEGLR